MLAIVACLLELTAYVVIAVNGTNFYLPLELSELREGKEEAPNATMFSHELGWEPTYPNEHGYRGEEKHVNNAAIAVFGDSFTKGHPVIEESWPHLLEQKLARPVLNFGVGGYGTDQAYLRLEKRYAGKLETPYVALLVMSENIARVVNRYRGFYTRKINRSLTKPMFHKGENGKIHLLPNPLATEDDVSTLGNPDFLEEIGAQDYWYRYFAQFNLNHFVRFPYSYYLLKALPYYIQRGFQHRVQNHTEWEHLYQHEEATDILRFVILKFVDRARELGTVPVIVFLPNQKDLVDYQDAGQTVYRDFYDSLKPGQHAHMYDALAWFVPLLDEGEQISAFFESGLGGHYNPEGEGVISEGLYHSLMEIDTEQGLLGMPD